MSINFLVLVNIVVQFYLILVSLILMSVTSINHVKSIDFGYSLYNAKYREKNAGHLQ